MTFSPKPAAIHFEGANGGKVIDAEHHVRSECGNWVTVWTDYEAQAQNGRSDMKIPRERIVMIEPRETVETPSEVEREVRMEMKA